MTPMSDDRTSAGTTDWEPKPHLLTVEVSKWGEMQWSLVCPYTTYDDRQPCRMGMEPPTPCAEYEAEGTCWEGGFYAGEVGHVHPVAGCWINHWMNESGVSWDETVKWVGEWPETVTLPLEVWVAPDSDGWTEMGSWASRNRSSRGDADER